MIDLHRTAVVPLMALALASCGDDGSEEPTSGRPAVVVIAPHEDTLIAQSNLLLHATATSVGGDTIHEAVILWESSDTTVARADSDGWLRGKGPGVAVIRARVGEVVDSTSIEVLPAVAYITVSPSDTIVGPNGTIQYVAVPHDSLGTVLAGRTLVWRSLNTTIVTVDPAGLARVRALDSTTITVSSGLASSVAWARGGARYQWVNVHESGFCAGTLAGKTVCAGYGSNVGSGSACDVSMVPASCWSPHPMPAPIDTLIPQSSGRRLNCSLTDGAVTCWGTGSTADLPASPTGIKVGPHQLQGLPPLDQLAMGDVHACGIAGTAVLCWGTGYQGAVGRPGCTSIDTPCAPGEVPGISATRVSVGRETSCALTTGQQVACWGVLGADSVGAWITSTTPVVMDSVAGATSVAIADGGQGFSACALGSGGTAWCWGENQYRLLGDSSVGHLTPRRVAGLPPLTSLVGGARSFCGLDATGGAWCWGFAGFATWGVPLVNSVPCGGPGVDGLCRLGATHLASALSFTELSIDDVSTCGMATDGYAYCWGGTFPRTGRTSGDDPTKAIGQLP